MKAKEIMTRDPACCGPSDSVQRAATLMADHDCGCIPVTEGADSRVVGVITDRDIAVRGVALGKGPDATVRDLMSTSPCTCTADMDVKEVQRMMAERQLRRIVVVDHAGSCVGIIAQADLALAAEGPGDVTDKEVARVVERISEPSPDREAPVRSRMGRNSELEQPF